MHVGIFAKRDIFKSVDILTKVDASLGSSPCSMHKVVERHCVVGSQSLYVVARCCPLLVRRVCIFMCLCVVCYPLLRSCLALVNKLYLLFLCVLFLSLLFFFLGMFSPIKKKKKKMQDK